MSTPRPPALSTRTQYSCTHHTGLTFFGQAQTAAAAAAAGAAARRGCASPTLANGASGTIDIRQVRFGKICVVEVEVAGVTDVVGRLDYASRAHVLQLRPVVSLEVKHLPKTRRDANEEGESIGARMHTANTRTR